MQTGLVLTSLGFALLCGAAVVRLVRRRHRASAWLAVSFAALALAATLSTQLGDGTSDLDVFVNLMAFGLLLHPVALVSFADSLRPVSRIIRLGVVTVAAFLMGAVGLGTAMFPGALTSETPGPVASLVLGAVATLWLGASAYVGSTLARQARRTRSSVGRMRTATMAVGILGIAPALALPFLVPGASEDLGVVIALVACAVTWFGHSPPSWLLWAWSRRDSERLGDVELAAVQSTDGSLVQWLGVVRQVWDGDAAWLTDDFVPVVVDGIDVAEAAASTPTDSIVGVTVDAGPDGTWLLSATVDPGRLTVRTRVDPYLFGDPTSRLLQATAARMMGVRARHVREEALRAVVQTEHDRATSRLRDDVLSTLSHELRTPLVMLRGVPELLLARWDDLPDDERRGLVERMDGHALDLHRVVDSILMLAEARSGELVPRRGTVATQAVVDAGLERLRHLGVDTSRVSVELDEVPEVVTDVRLAGTILSELVHNGLTYSESVEQVHLTCEDGDEGVRLVVTDWGRGIRGDVVEELTAGFGRAGDVLTRDRRGLGIGLTLVTELATGAGVVTELVPRVVGTSAVMTFPTVRRPGMTGPRAGG